jgi:Na+-translocating ferredoxin:NAD+ oxidoreductase RnfG subunit
MKPRVSITLLVLFTMLMAVPSLRAKILTREEALQSAFPGAQIESKMIFLTDAELEKASKLCGQNIESALVARFTAIQNNQEIGRAYLDTALVRTKKQSLLVLLNTDGTIKRIEVVAFLEPPEYMAMERWYDQFKGKTLTDDLRLNRSIRGITGATLTARATTEAVRRVLAIDQVLHSEKEKNP